MSESNGYVTRDMLLARVPRRFKDVQVPGLGKVRIRSLTEAEVQKIEQPNYRIKGKTGTAAVNLDKLADQTLRYIAAAVVDGNGDAILSNADVDDLRQKDKGMIDFLYREIESFCGLEDSSAVEKKESLPTGDSQ